MISKETILNNISQEDIMRRYFPYEVSLKKSYKNPFREDKNPGCVFKYSKAGVLYFLDWSKYESYDCFRVASEVTREFNLQKLLRIINRDFNLNLMPTSFKIGDKKREISSEKKSHFFFKKERRDWFIEFNDDFSQKELEFWEQYGLTRNDIEQYVKPVKRLWFNQEEFISSTDVDPIFHLKVNNNSYQIYSPYRKNNSRFYSMTSSYELLGKDYLKKQSNIVIITSSFKDILILNKLGYEAISPVGESTPILKEHIDIIMSTYDAVFINYNDDEVGIEATQKLIDAYPNYTFHILKNKIAKDPSDVVKHYGIKKLKEIIIEQL